MKRLPKLEKMLSKLFYPEITISNRSIKTSMPLYDAEIDIPSIENTETLIDTIVTVNNNIFLNKYKEYLYKLKEETLNEITKYCEDHNKEEIKKYLSTIYFNLQPLKDYYTLIKPNYIVAEVSDELKKSYKEFGYKILLEEKHISQINQFINAGLDFYTEVYETYRKFYEQYHNRLFIAQAKKIDSVASSNKHSFRFSNKIEPEDYPRIFFFLNKKLIDTDPDTFMQAFFENGLTEPKIKWLLKDGKYSNKRALFYFMESGLFEHIDDDKLFIKKIKSTFTDEKGNSLGPRLDENLRQFNADRDKIEKKNPSWKKDIDCIVQDILT